MMMRRAKFANLRINYESMVIINNQSEIYVSGNNKHCKLGIAPSGDDSKEDTIRHIEGAVLYSIGEPPSSQTGTPRRTAGSLCFAESGRGVHGERAKEPR